MAAAPGVPTRPDSHPVVLEVGAAVRRPPRPHALLVTIAERVRDALGGVTCSVLLLDEDGATLRREVVLGEGSEGRPRVGEGLVGRVAATGVGMRVADAGGGRSLLCVPMADAECTLGVVEVLGRRPFAADDQRLLEAVAALGAVALGQARRAQDLEAEVAERTAALSRTAAELRAAHAQVVQAEKMAALGGLVAGVAHEINTPLGALSSNADLLARVVGRALEALEDPSARDGARRALERAAEVLGISRDACRRIDGIVRRLRTASRPDDADRKPADLNAGLDSTLALVGHLVRDRITVRRELGLLPAVECRASQLNQVFLNVLVNAVQAIAGSGEIAIRSSHDPAAASVVVEIADSGCGIAPEHLARVFDAGFTTKDPSVGTGLGLAISSRIVADHGGRIEIDSLPGRGTTVRIVLPSRAEA